MATSCQKVRLRLNDEALMGGTEARIDPLVTQEMTHEIRPGVEPCIRRRAIRHMERS